MTLKLDTGLPLVMQSQGLVFHGFGNDLAAFAKDVMEAAIREWNSNNGKIDAGVRFFFGNLDNPSKEFLPLVAVDKVLAVDMRTMT